MTNITEGYKQTEIGVIPEEWDLIQLKDISEFITKGATPTTYGYEWQDKGVYFFKSDCVKNGRFVYGNYKFISLEAHNKMERSKVRAGDILLSITGNIGKACRIPQEIEEANINQHVARIRINNESMNSEFVFQQLCQEESEKRYYAIKTGQAYPQISLKQVRETFIPKPSLFEQNCISEILSSTDEHIEKLDKVLVDYELLGKGILQKLLREGMGNTEFKDSEIGKIPKSWKMTTLDDNFEFYGGYTASRAKLTDVGALYLHYGDIHLKKRTYISTKLDAEWLPRYQVEREKRGASLENGDIVFADASEDYDGVGKSIVVENESNYFVAGLHTLVAKEKSNTFEFEYKRYFLQANYIRTQFRRLATGAKVYGISKGNIGKIMLPIPTKEEQEIIGNTMASIEEKIEILNREMLEFVKLKNALMDRLLTGKIRVNQMEE